MCITYITMDYEINHIKQRLCTLIYNGLQITDVSEQYKYKRRYKNEYKTLLRQYQQLKQNKDIKIHHVVSKQNSVINNDLQRLLTSIHSR